MLDIVPASQPFPPPGIAPHYTMRKHYSPARAFPLRPMLWKETNKEVVRNNPRKVETTFNNPIHAPSK